MKLPSSLLALSLTLVGANGKPFVNHVHIHHERDLGVMLEPRAPGMVPTYQEVLAASLVKYPGFEPDSAAGSLKYSLKPCDDKCSNKKQIKDKDGNCTNCPAGQKADEDQTKCIPDPGKEKGKCPDDKVLDPSVGGQDANTDNPKCIADDDRKCPEGQTAGSRRKGREEDDASYTPECGVDEDPDFTCDDPNTYDYKTASGGKIEHRCRSTQKNDQDKKDKYDQRIQSAKGGDMTPEERDKAKKKQGRTGYCFVLMASIGMLDMMVEEIQALTDDEIDGMYAGFPADIADPEGDGTFPNYMVMQVGKAYVMPPEAETAGLGGIISAIAKGAGSAAHGASIAGASAVRSITQGVRRLPSKNAGKAATKSPTIEKIFKHENFLECLSSVVGVGAMLGTRDEALTLDAEWYRVTIDPSLTPEQSAPAPAEANPIIFRYDSREDKYDNHMQTFHSDDYWRTLRIPYEQCGRPRNLNDKIASLGVENGCCSFYDGENCEADTHMFDMGNRAHGDLQADHRNAISSFWCTYDINCAGAPKP